LLLAEKDVDTVIGEGELEEDLERELYLEFER
jgi:hypothetical protein